MPAEIRFSLGAFFLVIGVVAVYQKLRPVSVGGRDILDEAEEGGKPASTMTADGRQPQARLVLWVVSIAYLTIVAALAIMFFEEAARQAMRLAQWVEQLLDIELVADVRMGSPTGPLTPAVSPWTWVLVLLPLVFVLAVYGIVRLQEAGRCRTALAAGCIFTAAALVLTPFALAALRVMTGDAYREELAVWLDTATPAWPSAVWGEEGPVIMEGFVGHGQYREVEPGILYRLWTEISETGEASRTEIIYPFRMGPFTIDVGQDKDYGVEGIQSIDRAITVNERLKVAGCLSGGILESRGGMPIMIMPSSFVEWRDALRAVWVRPSFRGSALILVAVAWNSYILLALIALVVLFIVQMGQNNVKTSGEEGQQCPEQPTT